MRGFVELFLAHAGQQRAVRILIEPVERLNQNLDGLPHLPAKLLADFLLILRGLGEQRFDGVLFGNAEETLHAQQRGERLKSKRLLEPERRIP